MARKRPPSSSRPSTSSSNSSSQRIVCSECNREFSYQSSLSRHQLKHQQIGKAPKVRIAKSYRPKSKKLRPRECNNNVEERNDNVGDRNDNVEERNNNAEECNNNVEERNDNVEERNNTVEERNDNVEVPQDPEESQDCECLNCGQNFQKEDDLWEHLFGANRSTCGQESVVTGTVKVEDEEETINNVAVGIEPMNNHIAETFYMDPSDPEIRFRPFSSTPKTDEVVTEKPDVSSVQKTPRTRSRSNSTSSSRTKRFACGSCGLVESTSKKILYHTIQQHMRRPPYACPWCETLFETKKTLTLHCRQECKCSNQAAEGKTVVSKARRRLSEPLKIPEVKDVSDSLTGSAFPTISDQAAERKTVVSKSRRRLSEPLKIPEVISDIPTISDQAVEKKKAVVSKGGRRLSAPPKIAEINDISDIPTISDQAADRKTVVRKAGRGRSASPKISKIKYISESPTRSAGPCVYVISEFSESGKQESTLDFGLPKLPLFESKSEIKERDFDTVSLSALDLGEKKTDNDKSKGRRRSLGQEKRRSLTGTKVDSKSEVQLPPPIFDITKPVCTLCSPHQFYTTMNISLLHYLRDHLVGRVPYACCHCVKVLPHKKALQAHIRSEHIPPNLGGIWAKDFFTEIEQETIENIEKDRTVVLETDNNLEEDSEKKVIENGEDPLAKEDNEDPQSTDNKSQSAQNTLKEIERPDFAKREVAQVERRRDDQENDKLTSSEIKHNSTAREIHKVDSSNCGILDAYSQRDINDNPIRRKIEYDCTPLENTLSLKNGTCAISEPQASVTSVASQDSAIDLMDQDEDSEDLPELIVETDSNSAELAPCDSVLDMTCDAEEKAKAKASKDGNACEDVIVRDKRSAASSLLNRRTRSASKAEELQDHRQHRSGLRSPTRDTRLSCPICQKLFRTQELLGVHLGTHADAPTATLNPQAMAIICCLCGEKIYFHSSYERHLSRHANETFSDFCLECGRGFSNLKALNEHTRTAHRSAKVKCQICNQFFGTWEDLAGHRKDFHVECGYGKDDRTPSKLDWLPSPVRPKGKDDSPLATDDSGSDDIAYLTLDTNESPDTCTQISTRLMRKIDFTLPRQVAGPLEIVNTSASSSFISEPPELDLVLDAKDVSIESMDPPELQKVSPNRRIADPPELRKISPNRGRSSYKPISVEPPLLRPKTFRLDHEDFNRSSEAAILSPINTESLHDTIKLFEDDHTPEQSSSEICTPKDNGNEMLDTDITLSADSVVPEEDALSKNIDVGIPLPVEIMFKSVKNVEYVSVNCEEACESVVKDMMNEIISNVIKSVEGTITFVKNEVESGRPEVHDFLISVDIVDDDTGATNQNSGSRDSLSGRNNIVSSSVDISSTDKLDNKVADSDQQINVSTQEVREISDDTQVDEISHPEIASPTYPELHATDMNNNLSNERNDESKEPKLFVEVYRDRRSQRRQPRPRSDCFPVRQGKVHRTRPKSASPNSSSKSQMISDTVKALKRFLSEHKEQLEKARRKSPVRPQAHSPALAPNLTPNRLTSDGMMWETQSSEKSEDQSSEKKELGDAQAETEKTDAQEKTAETVKEGGSCGIVDIEQEPAKMIAAAAPLPKPIDMTVASEKLNSVNLALGTTATTGFPSSSSDDVVLLRTTPATETSPSKQSREGSDDSVIILGESQGDVDEDYLPKITPNNRRKRPRPGAKSVTSDRPRLVEDFYCPKALTDNMVASLPAIDRLKSERHLSEIGSEDSERTIITGADAVYRAPVAAVPEATIDVQRWLNQIPTVGESLITDDVVPDDETLNDAINNVIDFSSTQLPELGDGGVTDDDRSDLSLLETRSSIGSSVKSEPINCNGTTLISAQPLRRTSTRKHKCTVYCTKDSHPARLTVPRHASPHQRFPHQAPPQIPGHLPPVTVTVQQMAEALRPMRGPRPVQRIVTPHPQSLVRRHIHPRRPANASGNYLLHHYSIHPRPKTQRRPPAPPKAVRTTPAPILPHPQPQISTPCPPQITTVHNPVQLYHSVQFFRLDQDTVEHVLNCYDPSKRLVTVIDFKDPSPVPGPIMGPALVSDPTSAPTNTNVNFQHLVDPAELHDVVESEPEVSSYSATLYDQIGTEIGTFQHIFLPECRSEGIGTYHCASCSGVFNDLNALQRHSQTHTKVHIIGR